MFILEVYALVKTFVGDVVTVAKSAPTLVKSALTLVKLMVTFVVTDTARILKNPFKPASILFIVDFIRLALLHFVSCNGIYSYLGVEKLFPYMFNTWPIDEYPMFCVLANLVTD